MKQKNIIVLLIILIILLCITLFLKKLDIITEGYQTVNDGYAEACRELTLKRNFLKDYISQLRQPIQDLSANLISAKLAKKENMNFQTKWENVCSNLNPEIDSINRDGTFQNNTTTAEACRVLASVDKYELAVLTDIDIFFGTVLYANQAKLDYVLQLLNFYTNVMQCPVSNSSKVTFDASENLIVRDASGTLVVPYTNHINISRDLGNLDTATLALELEKLSPYYLSPDVVKFIIKFMISQETLDYLHTTSLDYIKGNRNLTNKTIEILSL